MRNEIPHSHHESDAAHITRNRWMSAGHAALEANEATTVPIPVISRDRHVWQIPVNNHHGSALTNVDPTMLRNAKQQYEQTVAKERTRRQAAALEDTNPNMPVVKPDEPWYNELPYGVNRPQQHP